MLPPTGASPTFSDDAFGAQTVYSGETVTSALRGTCSVCCSAAAAHGLSACSAAYLMRGFLSILVVEVAHDAAPGWGPVSRRCAGWRTQFSRRWRHLHHVSGSGSDQCARDQRERHEHGGVVAGLRGERGRLPWGLAHTARPAGAARSDDPGRHPRRVWRRGGRAATRSAVGARLRDRGGPLHERLFLLPVGVAALGRDDAVKAVRRPRRWPWGDIGRAGASNRSPRYRRLVAPGHARTAGASARDRPGPRTPRRGWGSPMARC